MCELGNEQSEFFFGFKHIGEGETFSERATRRVKISIQFWFFFSAKDGDTKLLSTPSVDQCFKQIIQIVKNRYILFNQSTCWPSRHQLAIKVATIHCFHFSASQISFFNWLNASSVMSQKSRVIALYKHLQYLGREYPINPEKFRVSCKRVFTNNSKETDPTKIDAMIAKGERGKPLEGFDWLANHLQATTLWRRLKRFTPWRSTAQWGGDTTELLRDKKKIIASEIPENVVEDWEDL